MNGQDQFDPAGEIGNAVRGVLQNVSPFFLVGVIVVLGVTLGWFTAFSGRRR